MITFAMAVLLMSHRAFLVNSALLNKMACFYQPIRFRDMTFESTCSYPVMESSMFQSKDKCSLNIIKQLLSFRHGLSLECVWIKTWWLSPLMSAFVINQ